MKITIRDIAEAAGVSIMTVSTVLNGAGKNVRVSDDTAKRVRKFAEELHYQPNQLARSLRSRKTNTVGVVFQHFGRLSDENPYQPQLLNGVMAALFESQYTLALCPTLVKSGQPIFIADGRFDGILWVRPDFTEGSIHDLRNARVPIVLLHAPPSLAGGLPTFVADNEKALLLAVSHLEQLGHKFISFAIDEINTHSAEGQARIEAFLHAINRLSLQGDWWEWDERPRTLREYLSKNDACTAMICFSDTLAGQIINSSNTLGIQIPRDLSVIGFDSSIFCERTVPRLTSVHQRVEKMAYDATSHLIQLIESDSFHSEGVQPFSSLYACGLDVRDSTARPFTVEKNIYEIQ